MGRKSFPWQVDEVGRQQCRRAGATWDTPVRGSWSSPVTGDPYSQAFGFYHDALAISRWRRKQLDIELHVWWFPCSNF